MLLPPSTTRRRRRRQNQWRELWLDSLARRQKATGAPQDIWRLWVACGESVAEAVLLSRGSQQHGLWPSCRISTPSQSRGPRGLFAERGLGPPPHQLPHTHAPLPPPWGLHPRVAAQVGPPDLSSISMTGLYWGGGTLNGHGTLKDTYRERQPPLE